MSAGGCQRGAGGVQANDFGPRASGPARLTCTYICLAHGLSLSTAPFPSARSTRIARPLPVPRPARAPAGSPSAHRIGVKTRWHRVRAALRAKLGFLQNNTAR